MKLDMFYHLLGGLRFKGETTSCYSIWNPINALRYFSMDCLDSRSVHNNLQLVLRRLLLPRLLLLEQVRDIVIPEPGIEKIELS